MPLASLLTLPTNARGAVGFVFDHDQLHREMLLNIAPDKPPIIDPAPISATLQRAGSWHNDHQIAHDNFSLAIFGFEIPQNMADSTFADKLSLASWTFINHQEHYLNNQIL